MLVHDASRCVFDACWILSQEHEKTTTQTNNAAAKFGIQIKHTQTPNHRS